MKNQLKLNNTLEQGIAVLSGGNPGAMVAILEVIKVMKKIDPINALGGFSILIDLDSMGINGSNIHILFKDICHSNPGKLITIMRARQLGYVDEDTIIKASKSRGMEVESFDFTALRIRIKKYLDSDGYEFDPLDVVNTII